MIVLRIFFMLIAGSVFASAFLLSFVSPEATSIDRFQTAAIMILLIYPYLLKERIE